VITDLSSLTDADLREELADRERKAKEVAIPKPLKIPNYAVLISACKEFDRAVSELLSDIRKDSLIKAFKGIADVLQKLPSNEMQRVVELLSGLAERESYAKHEKYWSNLPMSPEPDKQNGFVYIGNDTWLPKPLYDARRRQQRKTARKAERGIIWTR